MSLELGGKSAADRARRRRPRRGRRGRPGRRPDEQRAGVRRPDAGASCPQPATARWSTPWRRWSTASSSATRPTRPPRSARSSPAASRSGSATTSSSGRRRAPAWWSAAPTCPTASTGAGTCARRCSPTSTTPCGIAREEIFGPVLSVIPYRDERRRGPHRQRLRLRPVRLGVDGRRRPGPGGRPAGPHGHLRRQPALQHGPGRPVRRGEGQRDRAGARAARGSTSTSTPRRSRWHRRRERDAARTAGGDTAMSERSERIISNVRYPARSADRSLRASRRVHQ